ncbi:MAG: hypothetical protein Tsb002_38640 [Wenzhouxiangellaceae bacterium]
MYRLCVFLYALFAATQAQALACGDIVTGYVRLDASLHCSSDWYALMVGGDNTTIDLNGHTLSGTRDQLGIDVLGYQHVSIVGNGRLSGFWAGIRGHEAHFLKVENTWFDNLGTGITLSHTSNAEIRQNRFSDSGSRALSIRTTPYHSTPSSNNIISDNEFTRSDVGIHLCGITTRDNQVLDNRLSQMGWTAIQLEDETHSNQLHRNDVTGSYAGLAMFNSNDNEVSGERYTDNEIGVWLAAQPPGPCRNTASVKVRGNVLKSMSLFNNQIAARFGGTSTGAVVENKLYGSKVYDNQYGFYLDSESVNNTTVDSALYGTVTPITDLGSGNITTPNYCSPGAC